MAVLLQVSTTYGRKGWSASGGWESWIGSAAVTSSSSGSLSMRTAGPAARPTDAFY